MADEVGPFVDWRQAHPCPHCSELVVYAGNGRPAKFCSSTCRRSASAIRRAAQLGLVERELVVVRSAPDVTVMSVDELLTVFAAVSGRLAVAALSADQFEVLTDVVWRKQRECREHMERTRKAAQQRVLAGRLLKGIESAPRMLPGFGPALPDPRASS